MAEIVLIACASKKINCRAEAKDLYVSPLFNYNLKYAHSLNPDKILILSAKYGLLGLDKKIEPYNITLNKMPATEIKKWANSVIGQLRKASDLDKDKFIFLAGNNYRKYLLPYISNYRIPMKGLGIGKQLKFLKDHLLK